LTGSERSKTSLTRLNSAVLAPMPSASESTVMMVNAGDLASWRTAKRRSESMGKLVLFPLYVPLSFGMLAAAMI
jgi:hypothetical protein